MRERTEEIEANIQSAREALRANATALEDKLRTVTDWRGLFRRRPWAMLATAFGAGIVLAAVTRGRGGKREAAAASAGSGALNNTPPVIDRQDSGANRQAWEPVRDALIGFAVMRASAYLEKLLAGATQMHKRKDGMHSESSPGSGGT